MSSILKALKKLEDEKATRQPDTLKIDSDILQVVSSQRYSTTSMVLAAMLLFAGGSIATYLYMKQDVLPVVDDSKKTMISGNTQPSPQTSIPAKAYVKIEKLADSIEIVPADRSKTVKVDSHKKQTPAVAAKSAPVGTPLPKVNQKQSEQNEAPTAKAVQPPEIAKPVPTFKVNGIAYQDGVTDSLAVINGVPVSNGSMIEGAKVEAIQKDRVRLNYKGEVFYISLGKTNR